MEMDIYRILFVNFGNTIVKKYQYITIEFCFLNRSRRKIQKNRRFILVDGAGMCYNYHENV